MSIVLGWGGWLQSLLFFLLEETAWWTINSNKSPKAQKESLLGITKANPNVLLWMITWGVCCFWYTTGEWDVSYFLREKKSRFKKAFWPFSPTQQVFDDIDAVDGNDHINANHGVVVASRGSNRKGRKMAKNSNFGYFVAIGVLIATDKYLGAEVLRGFSTMHRDSGWCGPFWGRFGRFCENCPFITDPSFTTGGKFINLFWWCQSSFFSS